MRRAKRVGALGLIVVALVAAFGLIAARTGGVQQASAQADDAERCSVPVGGYQPGTNFTCTQGLGVGGAAVEISMVGQNGFLLTGLSVTPGSNTGCASTSVITIQTGLDLILYCNTQTAGNFFTNVTENFLVLPNGIDGEQLEKDVTCFSVWAPGTRGTPMDAAPAGGDLAAAGAAISSLADLAPSSGPAISGAPVVSGGVPLTGQGGSCGLYGVTAIQGGNTEVPTGLSDQTIQEFSKGVCNTTLGLVTYLGNCSGVTGNTPTGETKTCTNTISGGTLNQVAVGTGAANLGLSSGTSFVLPMFGPASTCAIQLTGPTISGVAAGPFADGIITVTLSNATGSSAVIACGSTAAPSGQTLPTVSGGGGACTQQSPTTLLLPCGRTAGVTAQANTPSQTCTGVTFDIESALAACVSSVVNANCVNPSLSGLNFAQGGTATVTVSYAPTAINTFATANSILGTNTFSFQGSGIGALIVAASPQLIPSNGTLASVVSATFACTSGYNLVNGFPLSSTATNLPLTIGANGQLVVSGTATGCGAGLPGTFTFSTPGPVLFDNGRSTETIACGPNANVNAFGNGSPFFSGIGTTFPLAFTCTGAAVLAIGAGAAGDAPINVSYQSAVGGLQAVGSTLLTVSPSGIPRISVACNPSSISAGNTGSLCTATVTDINGVPLTGITGATVTFTTSDPTTTSILPCTIGTPGAINVTTSPAVIPLVTPQTPCVTPSSTLPGQVNTFINGQATALLVASSTAHPEVVTVTAALGVLIPPSFACLVAPYTSSGFGTTPLTAGYYAPTTGTGVFGCGSTTPIGTTGLATALNVAGGGLTGIVTLPNTTSASTTVTIGGPAGIQVAGATSISPIVLSRGCNNVIITAPVGTPVANIAALVTPQNSVVSIWRFNNGTKLFNAGFFSDPNAPTDFTLTGSLSTTTAPNQASTVISGQTISNVTGTFSNVPSVSTLLTESYYVCVNQQATMISG